MIKKSPEPNSVFVVSIKGCGDKWYFNSPKIRISRILSVSVVNAYWCDLSLAVLYSSWNDANAVPILYLGYVRNWSASWIEMICMPVKSWLASPVCAAFFVVEWFPWFFSLDMFSQVIRQIRTHGKIRAQGSFPSNAERGLASPRKNLNQPLLFEMMYVRND